MNLPSLSVGSKRDESPVLHSDTFGRVWTATTVVSDFDVEGVYSVKENIRIFRRKKKKKGYLIPGLCILRVEYGKLKIFETNTTNKERG
jgi:hypothetical protein